MNHYRKLIEEYQEAAQKSGSSVSQNETLKAEIRQLQQLLGNINLHGFLFFGSHQSHYDLIGRHLYSRPWTRRPCNCIWISRWIWNASRRRIEYKERNWKEGSKLFGIRKCPGHHKSKGDVMDALIGWFLTFSEASNPTKLTAHSPKPLNLTQK